MIGENFPYSNFHDMNMDWIIKIAKDFLDQYTHLQDVITQGESDITELSEEKMAALTAEYERIDGLLNSWYTSHSEDIANALAAALLQISTALSTAINSFDQSATEQVNSLLDSMPADVSEIVTELNELSKAITNLGTDYTMLVMNDKYIGNGGGFQSLEGYIVSIARCKPNDIFIIKTCTEHQAVYRAYMFMNSNFEVIARSDMATQDTSLYNVIAVAPEHAEYIVTNNSEADTVYNGRTLYKVEGIGYNQLTGIFYDTGEVYNNAYFSVQDNNYNTGSGAAGYVVISAKCKPGDIFRLHGDGYGSLAPTLVTYAPWVIRNSSKQIISVCRVFLDHFFEKVDEVITIPENGAEIIITYDGNADTGYLQKFGIPCSDKKLEGKKMVWFGTSIPANKVNGHSYPELVARALGATVYNEAIGSSAMSDMNPGDCAIQSLAFTYAEKQVQSWYAGLTDAQKLKARDSSYDYVVTKYLSGGAIGQCDVYVFDHGYNDYYYLDPDDYDTEPANPYDKHYPLGAAHFLIQSILNDNPRAIILWISHYEGGLLDPTDHQSWGKPVVELQKKIADDHQIPLCPLYINTGWGNPTKVTTTGYWNAGYWVGSGGTSRQDYVKNCAFADGIHPTTDKSGEAVQKIADIITDWMRSIL